MCVSCAQCKKTGTPKLVLMSNHKSGTGYCHEVAKKTEQSIQCTAIHADDKDVIKYEKKLEYVVDLIREPYALIASSYGYHRQCPEFWTKYKFGTYAEDKKNMGGIFSTFPNEVAAHGLPPVRMNETYCGYLNRVDENAGLLAESIRTFHREIPHLIRSFAAIEQDLAKGAVICIGSLLVSQEKYADVWKPIFQAIDAGAKLQKQVLEASLWGGDTHTRLHSSNVANSTSSRYIAELMKLDAASLDFSIRNASETIGC